MQTCFSSFANNITLEVSNLLLLHFDSAKWFVWCWLTVESSTWNTTVCMMTFLETAVIFGALMLKFNYNITNTIKIIDIKLFILGTKWIDVDIKLLKEITWLCCCYIFETKTIELRSYIPQIIHSVEKFLAIIWLCARKNVTNLSLCSMMERKLHFAPKYTVKCIFQYETAAVNDWTIKNHRNDCP